MKIGFDAKRAFNNHAGLGVYSRNLIQGIAKTNLDWQLYLFTPTIKKNLFSTNIETISNPLGSLWRSLLIYFDIKKININIYHGLAGELPIFIPYRTKSVVTIHDVLFERFPKDYPWIDRKIYAAKAKWACRKADKIVAISEATKRDLVDYYSIDKNKIEVIPYGLPSGIDLKQSIRPHTRDFIVCIASFMKRKNQSLLAKAFLKIADRVNADLIFIGSGNQLEVVQTLAKNSAHHQRIIFKTSLNDDEKFAYFNHCLFSVYPSMYEGFGIPILESFVYKKPIIISDTFIHKEVAGDAGIYFENNNAEDLADKLLRTFQLSNSEREAIINKGWNRLSQFNADTIYQQWTKLYQELNSPTIE